MPVQKFLDLFRYGFRLSVALGVIRSCMDVARIVHGTSQTVDTLINEEALLLGLGLD
jgi:hypothetical protein